MKILEISKNVVEEFQKGMDIPYLYGMRLWLPGGSNPNDIAQYINNNSSYHAKAREVGINPLRQELPTLSISAKRTFCMEEIVRDISINEMAEILIQAYQSAEVQLPHLRSVRFWIPLRTLFEGSSKQAKRLAEYIEKNYSYQAHAKRSLSIPQVDQLPSLVIGSSKIIQ